MTWWRAQSVPGQNLHCRKFIRYCHEVKNLDADKQWSDLPHDTLISYMREFFSGIKRQDTQEDYQPSTLWSILSAVKRMYKKLNGGTGFTESGIQTVHDLIKARCKQLKSKGMGNLPNASDMLTAEETQQLYDEKCAGLGGGRYLSGWKTQKGT